MVVVLPNISKEEPHGSVGVPAEADLWSLEDLGSLERNGSRLDNASGMKEDQIGLAGFICTLLILGFTATGLVLRDIDPMQANTEMSDCARIDASAERLACYDRSALEQVTEPAKGAAPQLSSTQ